MAPDEATELYRFDGMKDRSYKVDRIVLEGTSSDPKRWVDKGDDVQMTEAEVNQLRKSGHKLTKVSDAEKQKAEEEKEESAEANPDPDEGEKPGESPPAEAQASSSSGARPSGRRSN